MEVNIQAVQGACSEYVDEKGKKQSVSIVISPLKVKANDEENKVVVQTGCNLWKSCHNPGCFYSMASRQRSKN